MKNGFIKTCTENISDFFSNEVFLTFGFTFQLKKGQEDKGVIVSEKIMAKFNEELVKLGFSKPSTKEDEECVNTWDDFCKNTGGLDKKQDKTKYINRYIILSHGFLIRFKKLKRLRDKIPPLVRKYLKIPKNLSSVSVDMSLGSEPLSGRELTKEEKDFLDKLVEDIFPKKN